MQITDLKLPRPSSTREMQPILIIIVGIPFEAVYPTKEAHTIFSLKAKMDATQTDVENYTSPSQ